MILERHTFEYQDKVLIEKVKIGTPFMYEAIFQNRGCFIYFKEKGPKLYSAMENIQINGQEAVLLNCGNHFLELLKESENEQVEVIIFHLIPEMLKKLYIKELPKILVKHNTSKPSQVVASNDIITKFIDSLEFYFQNPSLVNNDLLELKIKELILLLIQSKNVASVLELINNLYSTKAVQVKEIIKLHLHSNLTLEELAKLCHLSLSSFKREFKKEFNDSPTNYIISKKLEKAKELLLMTDLSISEIAYEVGFNDPQYFTRIFKKRGGISPSSFRNKTT
ncbi:AraC family transcriptional regulator [Flavobacteriales bacterium 33_180_T64]|nr:AraC family transcriptional regulator [Flavobacteriales bacterium 33_180_T64]